MGRHRGSERKRRYAALSVREKSFENRLRHLVRHQYGVCEGEAGSLVQSCLDYLRLSHPGRRGPLDVRIDVPEGRALMQKVSPARTSCCPVVLSPAHGDDPLLLFELGQRALQTARAVRLVEQATRSGCTMPLSLLASLVHLTSRTLVARLRPWWRRGLYLPVMGVPESARSRSSRVAEVLRGQIGGEPSDELRRSLLLTPGGYGRLLHQAVRTAQDYARGAGASELAEAGPCAPFEIDSVLEVLRAAGGRKAASERLRAVFEAEPYSPFATAPAATAAPSQLRSSFQAHLVRQHAFSLERARVLAEAVEQAFVEQQGPRRAPGDIVYWAVAQDEPAGKMLAECELVAASLPFYLPDEDRVARGTVGDLRVRKAVRLATEARRQGGLLSFADLAFLLGMSHNGLQSAIARAGLFIPTRGTIADIGPGVSHKVQIVRLYVEGYTEPQIVARTKHSYESVGAYVRDFRRVMLLVDQGLPISHIRKVVRMSKKLVEQYVDLYQELDVPEFQWKLNLMRRAALSEEKKRRR